LTLNGRDLKEKRGPEALLDYAYQKERRADWAVGAFGLMKRGGVSLGKGKGKELSLSTTCYRDKEGGSRRLSFRRREPQTSYPAGP